jgi:hypothetical protein
MPTWGACLTQLQTHTYRTTTNPAASDGYATIPLPDTGRGAFRQDRTPRASRPHQTRTHGRPARRTYGTI